MFINDLDEEIGAGGILALVNYLPYGSKSDRNMGYGSDHKAVGSDDPFSMHILNVKQMAKVDLEKWKQDRVEQAVAIFIYIFSKIIKNKKNAELSVIPSSKKDNAEHGMSKFCEALSEKTGIAFDRNTLTRTETVPKAATTGERDEDRHFETLKVKHSVAGKVVLLVDDVTTSGSSRIAAKKRLEEAGAQVVFFLALGQTLSHYKFSDDNTPCTLIAKHWSLFLGVIIKPLKNSAAKDSFVALSENNKNLLFYKKTSESKKGVAKGVVEEVDDKKKELKAAKK